MRFKTRFLALILGLAVSPLWLKAQDFLCPATLTVQQVAATVPAGWNAVPVPEPPNFDRVAFYLSNPLEGASLVPDGRSVTKGVEQVTWTFKHASGDQFWIGCIYAGTRVLLAQKLKSDVSACTVSYDLLPSGSRLRVKSITCK
jgi:hypothetical protein